MQHPFEKLAPRTQRTAYWVALAATAALAYLLERQEPHVIPAKAGEN